jgi:hypothetical protein
MWLDEPLNSTLRAIGRALFDLLLNTHRWPEWPEGVTATELRAALADLRHVQGYLAGVGREREEAPSLGRIENSLAHLAARQAEALGKLGDDIELGLTEAARRRIEHPDKPDPTYDLPALGELLPMCEPLPWEAQREGAREWLIERWIRGAFENGGIGRLFEDLRQRAARAESFGFVHTLALEMLSMLREEAGKGALKRHGFETFPAQFLDAVGIPANVAKHYRKVFR